MRRERCIYARRHSEAGVVYNLENHPYEVHNLVEGSVSSSIRNDMDKRLKQWVETVRDSQGLIWRVRRRIERGFIVTECYTRLRNTSSGQERTRILHHEDEWALYSGIIR